MSIPWNAYWRLMRFDRPIGTLLLLWPTWWALLLAGDGLPTLKNALIFTAGVVLMRAAGCVMNDIADRDFDPHVERTRCRPLAAGELSLTQALGLFFVLMLLAFGLVLMTNALTIKLAFVGAALAASYPFFKRVTHLPQVVLGIAFGWGVPMAFAAETGGVPPIAWWFLAINTVWSVIYDTLYAMVDRDDDLAIGVRSTAILFGERDVAVIGGLMVLMVGMLAAAGAWLALGWPWHAAVLAAALLFYRQWSSVRGRDRDACFRAFLNNNRVGLILFGSRAYLQTPLTFDTETTATLLDESEIGLAGRETAIGDAIGLAVKRLREDGASDRVLVLLTDGANTSGEVQPLQAAEFAAREGLTVYTVGVGADEMRVQDFFGSRVVNPSADLDEDTLRAIAERTGGRYFRARDAAGLAQIYEILDELEPVESDVEIIRPVRELFYWPMGLAYALALLAVLGTLRPGRWRRGAPA